MTKGQQFLEDYIKFPLYIMTHPIQGYRQFKEEKKGKTSVGLFYLAMMILASIFEYKYTGPVVAMYDQTKFSSISIIVYTIVPVVVLSVANWSITTLLDGKGKMKEIFLMGCYSFFPVVYTTFLCVILSNVVTENEVGFLNLLYIVATFLQGYLIFMGLVVLHEYGIGKTLLTFLFTIVATMVIMFIALLIFDLSQQIYGFLYSLYYEISMRFF
jgi:hypothetical protein